MSSCLCVAPLSSGDSDEEEDYEDAEVDEQKRRKEQHRRCKDEEAGEQGRWLKRKKKDLDRWTRLKREEEEPERMGRGKRREILSQQRRKRLAQMLKKRRRCVEEAEDEEDSESDSSSDEDRPVRKRLNRIDSDDEEEEEEGRQKTKNSSVAEERADSRCVSDAQEKGQGCSLVLHRSHWTLNLPDSREADGRSILNGPLRSEEEGDHEKEKEQIQRDLLNSAQNSPRS